MPDRPALDRGSQAAVISSIIAADPELQQLARQFVMLGLREMVNQFTRGDAQTRAAMAKAMSGAVTNLFTQTTADDGLTDLRTEMHAMVSEMRGDIQGQEENEVGDEKPVVARKVLVPKS